jgi:hypothetical protein
VTSVSSAIHKFPAVLPPSNARLGLWFGIKTHAQREPRFRDYLKAPRPRLREFFGSSRPALLSATEDALGKSGRQLANRCSAVKSDVLGLPCAGIVGCSKGSERAHVAPSLGYVCREEPALHAVFPFRLTNRSSAAMLSRVCAP